jgi:hypothetical protein
MAPKKHHYINNKEFLAALIVFREKVALAKEKGEPRPRISEYIGKCFLDIANHLSFKPNFINYMYKDDMIHDGVENCLIYIDNFDPEKSKNPFAYFTTIIYYAFLRRIQKEKKQMEVKNKILERSDFDEILSLEDRDRANDMSYIKSRVQTQMKDG